VDNKHNSDYSSDKDNAIYSSTELVLNVCICVFINLLTYLFTYLLTNDCMQWQF